MYTFLSPLVKYLPNTLNYIDNPIYYQEVSVYNDLFSINDKYLSFDFPIVHLHMGFSDWYFTDQNGMNCTVVKKC